MARGKRPLNLTKNHGNQSPSLARLSLLRRLSVIKTHSSSEEVTEARALRAIEADPGRSGHVVSTWSQWNEDSGVSKRRGEHVRQIRSSADPAPVACGDVACGLTGPGPDLGLHRECLKYKERFRGGPDGRVGHERACALERWEGDSLLSLHGQWRNVQRAHPDLLELCQHLRRPHYCCE